MRYSSVVPLIGLGLACLSGPSQADDLSMGVFAHDVNLSGKRVYEGGEELVGAWSGPRVGFLAVAGGPSPYLVGGVNLNGNTNFAAAGLRWKLAMTKSFYFRPGVGLAYNDAPTHSVSGRIWSGSHITLEPEASLGWQLSNRVAFEASWIHLSHAKLFSNRNPAIYDLGLRVVYRFYVGSAVGLPSPSIPAQNCARGFLAYRSRRESSAAFVSPGEDPMEAGACSMQLLAKSLASASKKL